MRELKLPEESPVPTLVVAEFAKVPLQKAVEALAQRYGRNVVIAPQADTKAATAVSADLMNVPFETAIEVLADMADLKVIFKSNVLMVTSKEHAGAMEAELRKRMKRWKADNPPVPVGCGGFRSDPVPETGIAEDPVRSRYVRQLPPV